MISKYKLMRLSENLDDDAIDYSDLVNEELQEEQQTEKEKYKAFYDDVKHTPKEDW